jgi:hypothetical protein
MSVTAAASVATSSTAVATVMGTLR